MRLIMDKKELAKNPNYMRGCYNFGLDRMHFERYEDIIILNTSHDTIYVILDKNFNTIGVHKIESYEKNINKEEIASKYNEVYNTINEKKGYCFPYPFQNLSLNHIINLSDRIDIRQTNNGHSYEFIVNGDIVIRGNNDTYISLLAYIKFLGELTKNYFFNAYQTKMLGFDYPDVHSYLKNLISKIDKCVSDKLKNNIRPLPINILEYIGYNQKRFEGYYDYLYYIIDLLMKEKGYKAVEGSWDYKEIEKTEKNNEDLSILVTNLLKILELSDEELEQKLEQIKQNFDVKCIDLSTWLEEDKPKKKIRNKNEFN